MGRTACTEPQCLYKSPRDFYYFIWFVSFNEKIKTFELKEFLNSTQCYNGTRFNFLFFLQILIVHSFCFKVKQHCFFIFLIIHSVVEQRIKNL